MATGQKDEQGEIGVTPDGGLGEFANCRSLLFCGVLF